MLRHIWGNRRGSLCKQFFITCRRRGRIERAVRGVWRTVARWRRCDERDIRGFLRIENGIVRWFGGGRFADDRWRRLVRHATGKFPLRENGWGGCWVE